MAEQHRVAHRAEERRADEEPDRGQRVRPARELGRREQPGEAGDGRDQVEGGREFARDRFDLDGFVAASDHRTDARLPFGAQFGLAAHARAAPRDRHAQRERSCRDGCKCKRRGEDMVVAEQHERATEGKDAVDPAQQPAVADADLAPARRHPAEEQAARRELQQECSGVELHQATTARSRGASFNRRGPASVATTMSSRRMPNRPGR